MRTSLLLSLAVLAGLAGCASVPTGPNVMALPGTGVSFEQFRADDMMCRDFAYQQIGGKAREQASSSAAIGNAAVGTAIGAVAVPPSADSAAPEWVPGPA